MGSRNAQILLVAHWLSFFGSKLHLLALPLIIYAKTGSARLLALGFLVETLPWIAVAPHLSRILQDYNEKWILIVSDIVRTVICVALVCIAYNTGTFLGLMFFLGVFNGIYGSFRLTIMRGSISKENLSVVLSLMASGMELIQVTAPALGGAMLAWGLPAGGLLLIDAASFFASALLLLFLTWRPQIRVALGKRNSRLCEGFSQIYHSRTIWPVMVTEAFRSFAEALYIPLFVVITEICFHQNDAVFGWSQTALSFGALVITLVFSRIQSTRWRRSGPPYSLLILGFFLIILLRGGSTFSLLTLSFGIGAAMSFRQLSAELILLEDVATGSQPLIVSVYNAVISGAYVTGYALNAITNWWYGMLMAGIVCVIGSIYQLQYGRRENGNDTLSFIRH